jgi:DNA-directed RNA polymerase alpha subunit
MNPHIENLVEENSALLFTLSNINVSLANAIRRTILADIPTVIFKTTPYEENKANIFVNTSRLNNEIIKQRLSSIPIYIKDYENVPLSNYQMEVNVDNNTDTLLYVTTADFKIKNVLKNDYLSDKDTKEIFPPNDFTGYYIDFVRLRPKISEELPGEKLHLNCAFSIGTAKENGMYSVVSTCAYGYTPDDVRIESELSKKIQKWKEDGLNKEEIEFESKNWKLLDGMRITKKDSFDFKIETIGVYSNFEIVNKSCSILINILDHLSTIVDTDELEIKKSPTTMENSFDIILDNEDYTIGKIIEYMFYSKFFEGIKTVSYCGFKKMHPHDTYSIIRVAYKELSDKLVIKQNLKECLSDSIQIFQKLQKEFLKLEKN